MKRKTSISLSPETIRAIDRLAGKGRSRSAVIEWAIRELHRAEMRRLRDARDTALINAHAAKLEKEALDALKYQADMSEEPT